MNDKINLRQLTDRLPTDIFGSDPEQRTQAVGEIFAIIAETLESGENVAVKGLGIFSLTGDKESPITFEPDRSFVAIVNAPFDAFSPVALPDEVTDSELAGIEEVEEAEEADSSDSYISYNSSDMEAEAEPEVEAEPQPEVTAVKAADPVPLTEPEPTPELELVPEVESASEAELESASEPELESASEAELEADIEQEPEIGQEAGTSRFGVGFFWGLLCGLLVGAILFMIYVLLTTRSEPMPAYEMEAEAADAAITAIE